jgi:hypothetical protein
MEMVHRSSQEFTGVLRSSQEGELVGTRSRGPAWLLKKFEVIRARHSTSLDDIVCLPAFGEGPCFAGIPALVLHRTQPPVSHPTAYALRHSK